MVEPNRKAPLVRNIQISNKSFFAFCNSRMGCGAVPTAGHLPLKPFAASVARMSRRLSKLLINFCLFDPHKIICYKYMRQMITAISTDLLRLQFVGPGRQLTGALPGQGTAEKSKSLSWSLGSRDKWGHHHRGESDTKPAWSVSKLVSSVWVLYRPGRLNQLSPLVIICSSFADPGASIVFWVKEVSCLWEHGKRSEKGLSNQILYAVKPGMEELNNLIFLQWLPSYRNCFWLKTWAVPKPEPHMWRLAVPLNKVVASWKGVCDG